MSHPEEVCGFIWKENNKTTVNECVNARKFSPQISSSSHTDASGADKAAHFYI